MRKILRFALIAISFVGFITAQAVERGAKKPSIMIVSSEQSGVFYTGGLAIATADLAKTLTKLGYDMRILMPGYLEMDAKPKLAAQTQIVDLDYWEGRPTTSAVFQLGEDVIAKVPTTFFEHRPHEGEQNYFDNRRNDQNEKKIYGPQLKEGEAFGALAKAQADYILAKQPDMVILNDWSAGLVAYHLHLAKLRGEKVPKVVFAIHNIAYQGVFPNPDAKKTENEPREFQKAWDVIGKLGLNPDDFKSTGYEYHDKISFMKAGIVYADMVYTVSPQYAKEIMTKLHGKGFDGLMRWKYSLNRLTGILNGIIPEEWSPSIPHKNLKYEFSISDLSGKQKGKNDMQREFGFAENANIPLFILTSRIDSQKGFAYLTDAIHEMVALGEPAQWVIIGDPSGDGKQFADQLRELAKDYPDRVRFEKFSKPREQELMRYGDFFINGAWFEPSGLNQFFALMNGTLPIVSRVGGLFDSVKNLINGITFPIIRSSDDQEFDEEATKDAAVTAFKQALVLFKDKDRFHEMRVRAMSEDHSWDSRIRSHFSKLIDYVMHDGWDKAPISYKPDAEHEKRDRDRHLDRVQKPAHPMSCKLSASAR